MANVPSGVRNMTFKEASAALVAANEKLQKAAKGGDLIQAALDFAVAERNARSAKARETENVLGVLETPVKGK